MKTIISNTDIFMRSVQQQRIAHVVLGPKSLFSVSGSGHRQLKKLHNPLFSAQAVKGMEDQMRTHAKKVKYILSISVEISYADYVC